MDSGRELALAFHVNGVKLRDLFVEVWKHKCEMGSITSRSMRLE